MSISTFNLKINRILALSAVACDRFPVRASVHPGGALLSREGYHFIMNGGFSCYEQTGSQKKK